jgi:hypothetical protein
MATSRDLPLKPPFLSYKPGQHPVLYRLSSTELLLSKFMFNENAGTWTRLGGSEWKKRKRPFDSGFMIENKRFYVSTGKRPLRIISRIGLTKQNGLYIPGKDISTGLELKENPTGTPPQDWTFILKELKKFENYEKRGLQSFPYPDGVILHNMFGFYVVPASEIVSVVEETLQDYTSTIQRSQEIAN